MAYTGTTAGGAQPTVPFTTAASDFIKLSTLSDNEKLSQIDFAATDFITLRESLVNYIKAVYPTEFQNFNESDLSMMLVELVAYMGAVLSMKADMLANENYLATAKNRNNVAKILNLIGARMKGPVSSAATATITLDNVLLSVDSAMVVKPQNRIVGLVSPEDGLPLTFTLGKVTNGVLNPMEPDGSLIFSRGESEGGKTWKNVVLLEGALAIQTGTFLTSDGIKTVVLEQSPIAEGSVEVFIDSGDPNASGVYEQVDNLFMASSLNDKIFELSPSVEAGGIVVFGDGENGISPPAQSHYMVSYRVGGGTRGNIGLGVIGSVFQTNGDSGSPYTGRISNTSQATGGGNAETVADAKSKAPQTFKRQDRIVTLDDYVAFVMGFNGPFGRVGKGVAATRQAYSSANIIDVYVLEIASPLQLQKASLTYKNALLEAIKPKKMITDEVVINDGYIASLDLVTTIRIDKINKSREGAIKNFVRDVIVNYFSVNNRGFGESFVPSDLLQQLYRIREIRYSTIDNIADTMTIDFNAIIQLNNVVINVAYI